MIIMDTTFISEYLHEFLFVYFPYIAGAVFLVGLLYRLAARGESVQALSSQFLSNDKLLKWGSNLFHYGIIFVFVGHIFGLLAPEWMYDWLITNEQKRLLAIVMGGASGIITLVGILMLMIRRFTVKPVRENSHTADFLLVVLVAIQVATGLLGTCETITQDLDYYMNLDRWAQGTFLFLPDSWKYLTATAFIHKLHILLGFLIVLIFPFTKLMHMIALPIRYVVDYFLGKK